MSSEKPSTARRRLKGIVVSDKMDKTVVVRVDRTIVHPKYHKRLTLSKKYKAHNPENTAKRGEEVTIEEMRPMSKDKRWRIVDMKAKKA